jgi:hypothetical protein
MIYLNNYKTFLLETKSISDSSEILQDKIWIEIESELGKFGNKKFIFNLNENDFKLSNLELTLRQQKYNENICNATTDVSKSSISNNILENSKIELNIYILKLDEDFKEYIYSVILHEILHVFQNYNLKLKNKFRPQSWSIGLIVSQFRGKFKSEYVNNIIDLLYHSLSHEMAAQIHHYYHYKKRDKDYKKINEIIKDLSSFNIKSLSGIENDELEYLVSQIKNCIQFPSTNKNYLKNIEKSMWNLKDMDLFLIELKKHFNRCVNWLNKKIKRIDTKVSKVDNGKINETIPTAAFSEKSYDKIKHFDPYYFIELISDINEIGFR